MLIRRLQKLQNLLRTIGFPSVLGILVCLSVAACQSQPAPTPTATRVPPTALPTQTPAPTATTARQINMQSADPATSGSVQFILAVPDQTPVDVYIEGTLITADALTYGQFTTPFTLAPDKYMVHVVASGQPISSQGDLLDQSITITAIQSTINVIGGSVGKLTLTPIIENLDPMPTGQSRMTIVSTTTDNSPINVAVDAQQVGALQTTTDTVPAQVLNAGDHLLRFTTGDKTVLTQTLPLLERQSYTVLLLGARSPSPLLVAVDSPTQQQAQVRVINASPQSGAVDVYISQTRLAAKLAYRKFTDWQTLPPFNSYEVRVMKAGAATTDTPLFTNSISLAPDDKADLVLFDRTVTQQDDTGRDVTQTTGQAQLFSESLSPTDGGQARLSVLNVADGTDAIQTMISGQAVSGLPPINYGTLSGDLPIGAGSLELSFDQATTNKTGHVELSAPLTIKAGIAYLYIVTGSKDRSVPPLLLTTNVGTNATIAATTSPDSIVQIRVINALSDVDNVDGYQGTQKVFSGVNQGQSTPTIDIDRTLGDLRFTASGSDQTVLTVQLPKKAPAPISVIAVGTAKAARAILSPDTPISPNTSATVRVIMAAPGTEITVDAASISAATTAPETSVSKRISFPAASVPVRLTAGTYTLTVYKAADRSIMAQLSRTSLAANTFYDVMILPGANGNIKLSLITTAISTTN